MIKEIIAYEMVFDKTLEYQNKLDDLIVEKSFHRQKIRQKLLLLGITIGNKSYK